jgi:hypothetical protein
MTPESLKDTLKRRVQVHPAWYYNKLIVAYSFVRSQSKAKTVEDGIKTFFNSIPESEREHLLAVYNGMVDNEKKNPKKARPKRFDD